MSRTRKPTQRLIESKEQQNSRQIKRQKQKEVLKKKIELRQEKLVQEVIKPVDNTKELEIIRDSTKKIYDGLYIDMNEHITKQIRLAIQEFPDGFLPPIFKGVVPLYIEKEPVQIKQKVLMSKLITGDYQTAGSKSDKGIASGIKTLLRIPELQKYDKDDLTDFVMNHREVFYQILYKCQQQNLSLPTFKSYIVRLMRVLVIAFKGKTQPVYVKYGSIMKDLMDGVQKIDDDNQLNENEKGRFIDWDVVIQKQKQLVSRFDALPNNLTKSAYDTNLDLVLLSLYTLTPVLRREVLNLRFKKSGDTIEHDYINVRKHDVKLELNLNKKRHDPIEIECSKELADILRQSYELYPRTFVFTDARKYPDMSVKVSEDSVADRLKKLFIYTGQKVGPSILRSSYATYRFDQANGRLPMTEVNEMARLMRTSAKYILTSYRKLVDKPVMAIIFDDDDVPSFMPTEKVVNQQGQIVVGRTIQPRKNDPYVKHNEKIKKKYKENDDYRAKVLDQQSEYRAKVGRTELQKRKIMSMLRNSVEYRKRIKPATLEKYGINLADFK